MSIVADPMKLSLPEQVGENKEQIKKIWEFLDGLSVSDNVIKITSLSQLTAEELEIVKREVAFIVYGNEIYYKTKTTSFEAIFEKLVKFELSEYVTLSSDKITVTLSNGALGAVSSSVNINSKSQVDSALALKAELSGAAFTGAVTAPTLSQNQPNFSSNVALDKSPAVAACDLTEIYSRFQVINQRLSVVLLFSLTNNTGSNITVYDDSTICGKYNTLPTAIAEKVYDALGKNVHQASDNAYVLISMNDCEVRSGTGLSSTSIAHCKFGLFNQQYENVLWVGAKMSGGNLVLEAGKTYYFCARVILDLI